MADDKVAVVTGSNAGLGLTLCERLLSEHKNLRLCLACRNRMRADAAQRTLKLSHPEADIIVVIIDTSNIKSVYNAAAEIMSLYTRIDFLFLNAGIMPFQGFDWSVFFRGLFSSQCVHMLTTGHGLLRQYDSTTDEGLRNVFATNLFGHYILIRKLDTILGSDGPGKTGHQTQIIWTSSSAAIRQNYDRNDIQHKNGNDPYSSSKFATDVLNVALNDRLNARDIYSHSMCPGLVISNLTTGIMPQWFWTFLWPFIILMRLLVPSMNYDAHNGTEAQIWLSHQRPETLDSHVKFCSQSTVFGQRSVRQKKLKISREEADDLFEQMEDLEVMFNNKYS